MRLLPLSLLLLLVTACDEPQAPTAPPEALPLFVPGLLTAHGETSFRQQGDPWMYYTPTPIALDEFVKLSQACELGGPVYVTLSGYDPGIDTTAEPLQVLGLGFSIMAPAAKVACMVEAASKYGAIVYP